MDPFRIFLTFYTWLLVYFIGGTAKKEQAQGGKSNYGRYTEKTVLVGWKNEEVPAYLSWFLFELPVLVSSALFYFIYNGSVDEHRTNAVSLLLFHYFVRTLIYPLLLRNGKPWRAGSVMFAMMYNIFFSPAQSAYNVWYGPDIPNWETNPLRYAGLAIFAVGFISNQYCDYILRSLRKGPEDTGYKIPRGFLFEYVTGANFFCEFVEWIGYAIFAGNSVSLGYAIMTFANTANRATAHHNWYLEKFKEEYPKDRKIYIPFVF